MAAFEEVCLDIGYISSEAVTEYVSYVKYDLVHVP